MADTKVTPWNEVDVNEDLTEADHKASENINLSTPVGEFLVTIVSSNAIEKTFDKYSCWAAKLKMRIDDVLKIEKPVFDTEGNPVIRDGEPLMKVREVEGSEKAEANALYEGRFIFDEINLYNPDEKEGTKNRRIYVARKTGLINSGADKLTTAMWGIDIIENQVIVTTEWNSWEDRKTKEIRKNVKVAWSGYEHAEIANVTEDDYSDI